MSEKVKRILADSYVRPSPCEHDPVIDHREQERALLLYHNSLIREGAEYQMILKNEMIDTGLMEAYQRYVK